MIKIKVAIISDIHGNCVALKEIVKDANKNGVSDFVFLGDMVHDLPFGNETLEIVRSISNKVIKGNKEQYLIEYDQEQYDWDNVQFRNNKFMYKEISRDNLEYLKTLPISITVEYEGVKILFVHGSPKSVEEQLHRVDRELLDKYTSNLKEDVLVFGHTHEKIWYEYINNKLVVSAGCAGVSPCYIGGAEYVILNIEDGKIEVKPKLVNYDIEELKQKIIRCGILEQDRVFMNLTYNAIRGEGDIRYKFFKEAKTIMLERNGKCYKDNAKVIFKYFKLYDDDIWLGLAEKYKEYFIL